MGDNFVDNDVVGNLLKLQENILICTIKTVGNLLQILKGNKIPQAFVDVFYSFGRGLIGPM